MSKLPPKLPPARVRRVRRVQRWSPILRKMVWLRVPWSELDRPGLSELATYRRHAQVLRDAGVRPDVCWWIPAEILRVDGGNRDDDD